MNQIIMKSILLDENSHSVKMARLAFPILVRQAKAGKTIYYSELAKEIGMSNPRNLNKVLVHIGDVIKEMNENTGENIPFINSLVVNKQSNIPSNGISIFYDEYDNMTEPEKIVFFNKCLAITSSYAHWDAVLNSLGLLYKTNDIALIEQIKEKSHTFVGGGESKYHLDFKMFVKDNPEILGLHNKFVSSVEYVLPSTDCIDVVFQSKKKFIGVEVKSRISDKGDILRGIFQCVKYKALIDAEQIYKDKNLDFRVILALETALPEDLRGVCNQLGVEVHDNIRNSDI